MLKWLNFHIFVYIFIYGSGVFAQGEVSEDSFFYDIPAVVTPTRLKQSMHSTPASVTVLTSEMIEDLSIRTIPEVLRLVPGITVQNKAGNFPVVQYHGTTNAGPRRMQILLDGIPVYRTGKAEVDWTQIPISIDDIDKIEVVRGPYAASYGSNSVVAIVNIFTKHTFDTQGWKVKAKSGSLDTQDYYLSYGGKTDISHYRLSLSKLSDSGYDLNKSQEERRDSSDINRLNFIGDIVLSEKDEIEVSAGIAKGENQVEYIDSSQINFPDIDLENKFLQMKWTHKYSNMHELEIKFHSLNENLRQEWISCFPQILFTNELRDLYMANPSYVNAILAGNTPSGGSTQDDILAAAVYSRIAALGGVTAASSLACGQTNQNLDLTKYDLEAVDTYILDKRTRFNYGFGFNKADVSSETIFTDGPHEVNSQRVFGNIEYKFSDYMLVNAGLLWEEDDLISEGETSPRLSIHYQPSSNHTIKFVFSKATRTPDLFEVNPSWNYFFRGLNPSVDGETEAFLAFGVNQDYPNLKSEIVESKEIIWYSKILDGRLETEIKLFNEDLESLISEKLEFFNFNPTNDGEVEIDGIEVQTSFNINPSLLTRFTYSYQDIETEEADETTFHTEHSGSLLIGYKLKNNYTVNMLHYANSEISGYKFRKTDINLLWKSMLSSKPLKLSLLYSYEPKKQGGFLVDISGSTVENDYKDNHRLYFSASYEF